jgi:hypothetical protein
MFSQPVRNYYRSQQFLYRGASILGLFLKNAISLRIKHLHELHLIAHFWLSLFFMHSALGPSKSHADLIEQAEKQLPAY